MVGKTFSLGLVDIQKRLLELLRELEHPIDGQKQSFQSYIFSTRRVLFCVSGANKEDVLSLLVDQLEVKLSPLALVKIH